MVTVSPAPGMPRTRTSAGPLRLLWLAALMFGFLYTHAAGADSATAHVTGIPASATQTVADRAPGDDHRHDGDLGHDEGGHSHPAEACDSAHPPTGSSLNAPRLVPLAGQTTAGPRVTACVDANTPTTPPPLRSSLSSVVQQV
ncbi:hypothetical protein [Streptomyces sp. NPDC006463]|uniref:hypothetical protein n=1 Tax=Streptomyces sp. NPDC006463 TaxID=3364746 RepID=UPI00367F4E13